MTRVNINGIQFNAADGEPADMGMFSEGAPNANDTSAWGMVEEMKTFIRLQDELKLRNLADVGALFGVFSLVFTRYEDAHAYAIEPSPLAWEGLKENIRLNPERKIFPIQMIVGDKNETVYCGREWRHLVVNRWPDSKERFPVECKTLDSFLPVTDYDCFKIDVEGYECAVLRGARNLIKACRPIIFLESHFSVLKEVTGDSNESLFALIKDLGYTPKNFKGETVTTFEGVNGHRYVLWPT